MYTQLQTTPWRVKNEDYFLFLGNFLKKKVNRKINKKKIKESQQCILQQVKAPMYGP